MRCINTKLYSFIYHIIQPCHHLHSRHLHEQKQQQQQLLRSPGCRSCSVNRLDGSGVVGPVDSQASSCRTLIIHGSLSDESWARYTIFNC